MNTAQKQFSLNRAASKKQIPTSLPPCDVLDAILKRYVEESKSAAEIVQETGHAEKRVRDIVRKIDRTEYKRRQAPPCLRVTTKAFGIGCRVPIAQRYVER